MGGKFVSVFGGEVLVPLGLVGMDVFDLGVVVA